MKRLLLTAALGALAPLAAQADNPANGSALFLGNCATNCHGSNPLASNSNKIYNGRNARAVIDAAINGVSNMRGLRAAFPSGGTALADIAAYLGTAPTTLSFPATAVGATSATQTVTLAASLKSGNAIAGLTVATSGDFQRSGGSCGSTVALGSSCTVLVSFAPSASGLRSGTLSLTHSNTLTPIGIALSGSGTGAPVTAPLAAVTPAALTLAATAIGATSPAQNVNVANNGNAALSIASIALSNSADFTIAGGTCSAGGSVAPGASCTVSVAFRPSAGATGSRVGSLNIVHNAAGSPGSVPLAGNATPAAAPLVSLTAALAFGSVNLGSAGTAQTATLANSGNAPLLINALATGSTEFTIAGGTCAAGTSVAAGASCSVNIGFTPTVAGARSANLVVSHNAGSSSTTLSGTGVQLNPVIGVSPSTLAYSQTVGTSSVAQTVTISNSGNAPLLLGTPTLVGAQAAEFQIAAGSTCGAGGSVAASSSCTIKLAFTPAATGARVASLQVSSNASGSPALVTLNGSGSASPLPAISLNATSLNFAAQTLASASAPQSLTVSNSGAAPLVFSALTLTGSAAGDFVRGGSCSVGGTLAVGASCSLSFSFMPTAVGSRSATLTLASNAANGSAVLSLSGSGAAAAAPALALAPGSLAFGNQTVGLSSSARLVSLSNTGSGLLSLAGISATAGFSVSHNCGASLPAGASCTLSVSFTPSTLGAASGSLSVVSNAAGSPQSLSLSGTGVAASPVLAWLPAGTALAFGDVSVGANPATQSLSLSNGGPGAVTLQQLTLAGAQAADFSLATSGSCSVGSSLAAGASCTVALAFQPGAVGARAATLQVLSTGTNPPDLMLSGNGTAMAQAAAAVVPVALSFSVAADATVVDAQTLALQSTGNAVLHVTALRVAAGSFTLAAAATNGCPATPFDLMPGQSCQVAIGWSSSAVGGAVVNESGSVEIDTSAAATPIQVGIQAVRAAAAPPALSNAGSGGCSIARGDTLADPTLWLLAALAAGVLCWRRRAAR